LDGALHSRITNLIVGIADDVLRDLYVRGTYRDVILPMTVLRRIDAVEPSKDSALDMKMILHRANVTPCPTAGSTKIGSCRAWC
jgi:type I restriction enzyme M protein